jgi:hypothetical protein
MPTGVAEACPPVRPRLALPGLSGASGSMETPCVLRHSSGMPIAAAVGCSDACGSLERCPVNLHSMLCRAQPAEHGGEQAARRSPRTSTVGVWTRPFVELQFGRRRGRGWFAFSPPSACDSAPTGGAADLGWLIDPRSRRPLASPSDVYRNVGYACEAPVPVGSSMPAGAPDASSPAGWHSLLCTFQRGKLRA